MRKQTDLCLVNIRGRREQTTDLKFDKNIETFQKTLNFIAKFGITMRNERQTSINMPGIVE